MFESPSDNNSMLLQPEQQQQQQPPRLTVDSIFLRVQPTACGKQYWRWRYQRDVIKLDFAYAVMMVCRMAASAYACTAPHWCLGLVLVSAALQLAMIAWRRLQYIRVRLALVCVLRLAWMCFSCYALRGIHERAFAQPGMLFSSAAFAPSAPGQQQLQQAVPAAAAAAGAAAAAAAAARAPAGEVAVLFAAASWLANLALQPLLQPVPFVLQAPLQALEVGLLLLQFHAVAFLHVEALPGLAAAMYRMHAVCEGMFHIGAGFVFLTAKALAGCSPGDLRLVANFVIVYAGLVLPLFLLYKAELLGKARFALSYTAGLTHQQRGEAEDSSNDGGSGATTDVSGSSRAAAEAVAPQSTPAQPVGAAAAAGQVQSSQLGGNGAAGSSSCVARLQLVGCVQPINREFLLEMLRCPRVRIKDDVICGMLLLLVTWGLCAWGTSKSL